MKKVLLGILIIIVIAFGIIVIRYAYNPSYDKSEMMTQEDIQNILNKRLNVKNIYAKNIREDKIGDVGNLILYSEFFVKDNMVKVVETTENGQKKIYQENRNTGEVIWLFETKECIVKYQNKMNAFDIVKGYDYLNLEEDVFISDVYTNLDYLGKTKIDDRNVIVILLERNDVVKEFIYIDEETGFILKHITKNPLVQYVSETKIKVDFVTDDEVKMIDYEKEYPNYKVTDMK